ncbi:HIT family protein [Aeromicrobium sp. CF4.19]|uniref:HIT family protein n=1 Tax=Aeromicrobium sp. CF4.19 TaxID=3373082 RepID=UPI003EE61C2F
MTNDDHLQRLWAPYRMAYVRGAGDAPTEPDACPFCLMVAGERQTELIIARGWTCFVVLNLFPYNPGHLMVLPMRHVADYTELDAAETAELAAMTQRAIVTVRDVSAPDGFNVGINLGGVAGGSISQHLHQHVVPRWAGDANFMTVLGGTKTMPQLLEDTCGLLREAWDESDDAGGT